MSDAAPVDSLFNARSPATLGLALNLGVGAGVLLLALLSYELLRNYCPSHTYPRAIFASLPRARRYDGRPLRTLRAPRATPLSWAWRTLRYAERDVARTHGLDAALFVRFLATQAKLFAVLTVLTAVVLYPTYVTADNRRLPPTHPNHVFGMEVATLSNVREQSRRLWVTLLCEVFVVAIILLFLYRDVLKYVQWRRVYRSRFDNPANYAVVVQDVPPFLCEPRALFAVFDKVFPAQVVRVHLVRDAHALLALKNKYIAAVDRYRFLAARAHVQHAPPQQQQQQQQQPQQQQPPRVTATPTEQSPSSSSSPSPSPSPSHHEPPPPPPPDADIAPAASHASSSSSSDAQHAQHAQLSRRTTCTTLFPRADLQQWKQRQHELAEQLRVAEHALDRTAPLTRCAIVVFRSKRVATLAATAPVWINATECRVSRAPEPRAVNWNRLSITPYTKTIRQYTSFFVLTAMAVFWTVPATSIQALNNLQQLAEKWPDSFLTDFIANHPAFARFLQGILPPLILYILLLIVPLIIRLVVNFERIHSRVLLEAKIRNFIFFFYVMSNFFYVVVIGSVFQKLKDIFENPTQIVAILSVSVPAQSAFLMKYVLINAFLGSTLNLLNIGRLIVRPFLRLRAKTPREKRNADEIFSQFPFAKMYALCCMVSLISFVYSTIAPVICAVATLYYAIAYLCHKQQLLYSHKPQFEGGGFLFRDAWTALLVGLYFHQLSMIGIFGLKLATPQAILSALSLIFSIWFHNYCRKTFLFRAKHGSLIDQADMDDEEGLQDEIPDHFAELYLHPGLRPVNDLKDDELEGLTYEPKEHVR